MIRTDEVSPVYKTSDTTYPSPRLDPSTHAQKTINYEPNEDNKFS